jgi:hypothetical protein
LTDIAPTTFSGNGRSGQRLETSKIREPAAIPRYRSKCPKPLRCSPDLAPSLPQRATARLLPPPSVYIQDEPPFQKTYRLPGIAAIGMRTQADLDEAGQTSGGIFRNENGQRHRSASVSCQDWRNFLGMLCRTCLGPKLLVHARERITVGGGAAPHLEGRRAQTLRSYRKTRCCSIARNL